MRQIKKRPENKFHRTLCNHLATRTIIYNNPDPYMIVKIVLPIMDRLINLI